MVFAFHYYSFRLSFLKNKFQKFFFQSVVFGSHGSLSLPRQITSFFLMKFFNENKILFQLEKKVIPSIFLMTLVAENRHLSFIFIFKNFFFNENDGKQVTAVFRSKIFYWIRFLIAKFDILIFFSMYKKLCWILFTFKIFNGFNKVTIAV